MRRTVASILVINIVLSVLFANVVLASSLTEITDTLTDIQSIYDGKYWNANLSEKDLKSAILNGYSTPYNNYSMPERMEKLGLTNSGCKSSSKSNGSCTSNEFDGGIQCVGFANYIFFYLYEQKASSMTYRGNNITVNTLQPGDYIGLPYDHSAIVWKIEGDTLYCAEVWGSYSPRHDGCIIKFNEGFNGGFNTTSASEMLRKLKSDNGYFARCDTLIHRKHIPGVDCKNYETINKNGKKLLGACQVCEEEFDWFTKFERITGKATLKSSKKNYKVTLYKKPYEDAEKIVSGKLLKELPVLGTVKNAYGNEWYAVNYDDDKNRVCWTGYIYSGTLKENYDVSTTLTQTASKYETAYVTNKTHTHDFNYNNGQCYCGAVKSTQNATSTLKINLTSYPTQLPQGSNFGLRGTISSNYAIKKINGYIKQNGSIVQSSTDTPDSKSIDVRYANLNNRLIFNNLATGNYILEVYAVDASGNAITVSKDFNVIGTTEKAESSLSINLEKYPVNLISGNGFGLRGSVTSNYNVSVVRGYVTNSNGQTVLSSKDTPNSTYMDIRYANLNNNLVFNNLSAGNYTLKVSATDASGKSIEISKDFRVETASSSDNSTLSINLEKYPVTLNIGSAYGLRGSITSNYNISVVRGYVTNSSGQTVLSSKDTPNSTYMDIKPSNLNWDLVFNNLSAGNYTMKVLAVDASGRTVEATKNFTVKTKEAYVDNSANGNGVTGTVNIPSSWDNLSIRTGPSTSYDIIGSMNQGAKCTVYPNKTVNGWYYINYNGIWGYASGNQINLNISSSSTQTQNTRVGIVNIPSSWDNLSIRSGPSTSYQIVGSMNQGAKCTVYPDKESNGWYYVEYGGVKGYASGRQINLQ